MSLSPTPASVRTHLLTAPLSSRTTRLTANFVGAIGAGLFARAGLEHYHSTHSFVGAVFLLEEMWVVMAYLLRRRARTVTTRTRDWLLAFGGTFGGVLLRPSGAHPHWGVVAGLTAQLLGLALCAAAFASLGRSFGFAAADRGLKRGGPYAAVRHPLYASYVLLLGGYVLQSLSWRNVAVMAFVCGCNAGRARAEERLLAIGVPYEEYRAAVRWRLVPGIW